MVIKCEKHGENETGITERERGGGGRYIGGCRRETNRRKGTVEGTHGDGALHGRGADGGGLIKHGDESVFHLQSTSSTCYYLVYYTC